ncbi:kinetochore-associated protein 1-like [Periplaneta americana]|uniref:kinetochore-associated protein 1-like n=1 Tax=Periplaneta americana TaxID=6978 RepID=UPI0037E76945
MSLWTNVSIGFDSEEETVNFGTTTFPANNGSLFQSYTLAKIEPEGEISEDPHVLASSFSSGQVCVSANSSLIVFTNDTCSELQFTHTFESTINCFTVSSDGLFIIVGVGSEIHCLLQGQLLFSRSVASMVDSDNFIFVKIFIEVTENGVPDVSLVGNSGQIFRLSNTNTLSMPMKGDSNESLKQTVDLIQVQLLKKDCCKSEVSCAVILHDCKSERFVLMGDEITVWSESRTESSYLESSVTRIKAVIPIEHVSLLVALCEDGQLLVLCCQTLLLLLLWNKFSVQDMILLDSPSADDEGTFLLLTQSHEDKISYIQIVSLPGMEIKYKFSVSFPTYLMPLLSSTQEVLYLEGNKTSNTDYISSLHIKTIVESRPIDRYQKLLRRYKFDAAESFALSFGLDIELVYKERVKYCMGLLQPWTAKAATDESVNFTTFVSYLDKIQDLEFVCEACIKTITGDLTKTQTLLDYASNRLKNTNMEGTNTAMIWSMQKHLSSTSLRLDTFLLVYQSDPENLEWCKFSDVDLLTICRQHLQKGELNHASLIWARHWNGFKSQLTKKTVKDLLGVIPVGTPMAQLISWMRHFIPSVLRVTPSSVSDIVSWSVKSVKSLEVKRAEWPVSGLELAEQLLCCMKMHQVSSLDICSETPLTDEHLQDLITVILMLREVKQLKEHHKINIAFADYMQSDKSEVVSILLSKVAPIDIKSLMTNFLNIFIMNNGLECHTVLSQYVHSVLSHAGSWWYCEADAPWEATLAAIIPYIDNLETRIKCIISVLTMAPVPWSSTVLGIAKQGLGVDHPLTEQIRHEHKIMEVKIVQKKYGLIRLPVQNCTHFDFIRVIQRILKQGRATMLEDALKFSAVNVRLPEEAYILCIEQFITSGNHKKALNLLDSLSPELTVNCCCRLIFKTKAYMESRYCGEVYDSYMKVLGSIAARLETAAAAVGDRFLSTDMPIQELMNLYHLRIWFGKTLSLQEYSCVRSRHRILGKCVEDLLELDDAFDVYCKVEHVARLLQLSHEGVLEVVRQAIRKKRFSVAYDVMRNHIDCIPKLVCKKLLTVIQECVEACCAEDTQTKGLPQLAYETACKMCTECPLDELSSCVSFLQLVYTVKYLMVSYEGTDVSKLMISQPEGNVARRLFPSLYRDPALFSNKKNVLAFLQETFHLCNATYNDANIQQLKGVIRQLQEHHQDLGAVRLWCCLNALALSGAGHSHTEMNSLAYDSVLTLLSKVVTASHLDVNLGIALLLFLGIKFADQWFKEAMSTYRNDYKKTSFISELGVLFCNYCKLDSSHLMPVRTRCVWVKKLAPCGMSCVDVLKLEAHEILHMMMLKRADVSLIFEFCTDFQLESEDYMIMYLRTVLLSWQPEYEIEETVSGEKILIVKNNEAEIAEMCKNIIGMIEDKETLTDELNSVLADISYYNYEVYLYIINLFEKLIPAHKLTDKKVILLFLKKYKRIQHPKQEEVDDWFQKFHQSTALPVIANWRLPFLPFLNQKTWSVLTSELNLRTYKQWLELSVTLGVGVDNICSVAIKETVLGRKSSDLHSSWSVCSRDSLLLTQLEECVNRIKNLERASACMYFVMNHMPPGADKLHAARLCYEHTQKWVEHSKSQRAEEYLTKVRANYMSFATRHVLYKFGLGSPEYLQLVSKPLELLPALYQDVSITAKARGSTMYCPDINRAVRELADLHKLAYIKFCIGQLHQWLQPAATTQPGNLDDTFVSSPVKQDYGDDDDNLYRACYILQSADGDLFITHLVNLVLKPRPGEECFTTVRLRALQCLMTVIPIDKLEKITGKCADDIRQLWRSLRYTSTLEQLGLPYSVEMFESCNKVELIGGIWRLQHSNPQALVLLARLCVEFNIQQQDIWVSLLKQMTKYGMVQDLEAVLLHLEDIGCIISSAEYVRAWEVVLLSPFKNGEEDDKCLHSLILLQSCPVLRSINLKKLVERCLQMDRPHMAAVLLPCLSGEELNVVKQKVTQLKDVGELMKDLQSLMMKGVLIAAKAIQLLESSV